MKINEKDFKRDMAVELGDGQNGHICKGSLLKMRETWLNVGLDMPRKIKSVIWLQRGLWIHKPCFKSTRNQGKEVAEIRKYELL